MLTVGLLVALTAKPGREADVARLLTDARTLAEQEPQTIVWYAVRLDQQRFTIFDAFTHDTGRDAHLTGPIAAALMSNADELLAEPPTIQYVDVLAHTHSG